MSDRVCKNCCEYDSPKGSATGYCVMAKALTGCGVVPADGSCCRFAAGKFSDRLKIRAARNGTEEWLEKCLSCTHCYRKKADDETLYCRCHKGKCNYQEVR